jgi:hypothetical protein
MSHLAVKTVQPSMQSVERAVRKQARKNSLVLRAPVVLLEAHAQKCIKNLANHGILGIPGKLLTRQAKLLRLIKVNL